MKSFPPETQPTFRDPEWERQYRETGIVQVGRILDPDDVVALRTASRARLPEGESGLVIDYMRFDRARVRFLLELARPLIEKRLPEIFVDHRVVVVSTITKYPGADSGLVLHEDRTHVDESRYRAGNLWIPLVDVGPQLENGALEIVPRSHLLGARRIGTRTPDPWRPHQELLMRHAVVPELAAGEGVYYDNKALHTSRPNLTDEIREAMACLIVPNGAELFHVLATGRRRRTIYRIDDEFIVAVPPHGTNAESLAPYPVVADVEEEVRIAPERLVAVVADGDVDASRHDFSVRWPRPPEGVVALPRRLELWDHDVPDDAASCEGQEQVAAGPFDVDPIRGRIGVATVADVDGTPAGLPHWAAPLAGQLLPSAGAIVVLAEGALASIRVAPGPNRPWHLEVIDAAHEQAFAKVDDVELVLDESLRFTLEGDEASVWNHGPGAAALLVSMDPAAASPPAQTVDGGDPDLTATISRSPARTEQTEQTEQRSTAARRVWKRLRRGASGDGATAP